MIFRSLPKPLVALVAALAVLASAATAQRPTPQRLRLPVGGTNLAPRPSNDAGLVVQDLATGITPGQLAQSILSGSGVTVSNVQYSGVPHSAGTFTTTTPGILGFSSGIVLSSGDIASVVGPNLSDATSTDNQLGGDPDLQAIIPNHVVNDACVLEFDFTTSALAPNQTGSVTFNFVFSSEEYNEWVNTAFNDVFGFFLNGHNIALLQDLSTPVTIDNVNGGNPYGPPPNGSHPNEFRNNDLDDGGGFIDTEMDGLTITLTAFGNITGPGPHHIKLAIADAGDFVYDSNVFIQGSSLVATSGPSCIAPTPTSPVNATVQQPTSFEVRAIANHGGANASVTIQGVTATFDPGFGGNPQPAAVPGSTSPTLPTNGQPASTVFSWTPPATAVGAWVFTYTLVDDLAQSAPCVVRLNVAPSTLAVPTCIAPTPTGDVEAVIGFDTYFEFRAVANNGLPGATVTIQAMTAEFKQNFSGPSVSVPLPFSLGTQLPASGQPASVFVGWNPPVTAIGQWDFTVHLIDNLGQTNECGISVYVRDAILFIGVNQIYAPLTPGDVLRVEPLLSYPLGVHAQPDILVPNVPWLYGFDIYVQALKFNPIDDPSDPLKTSETIRYRIEISNLTVAPGNGLSLVATDIAELGENLPYDYSVL